MQFELLYFPGSSHNGLALWSSRFEERVSISNFKAFPFSRIFFGFPGSAKVQASQFRGPYEAVCFADVQLINLWTIIAPCQLTVFPIFEGSPETGIVGPKVIPSLSCLHKEGCGLNPKFSRPNLRLRASDPKCSISILRFKSKRIEACILIERMKFAIAAVCAFLLSDVCHSWSSNINSWGHGNQGSDIHYLNNDGNNNRFRGSYQDNVGDWNTLDGHNIYNRGHGNSFTWYIPYLISQ